MPFSFFNFIQHLFTVRALERALQDAELKVKNLEMQLEECRKQCEILNTALHNQKTPASGVTIDPPGTRRGLLRG